MLQTQTGEAEAERGGLLQRIAARLEQLGKTESAASKEAFGHASGLRNIRNGASKSPGLDTVAKLARVLDTTPEWLAFGVGEGGRMIARGVPRSFVPLIGEVAAGQWLEVDTLDAPAFDGATPAPADLRYPIEAQFGVVVRGTSINRAAQDGDVLVCVDPRRAACPVRENDVVIVERRRNGGHMIERTAKRYRTRGGASAELWPDSTDPRWQKPLALGVDEADETEIVEIIGVALHKHGPINSDSTSQPL